MEAVKTYLAALDNSNTRDEAVDKAKDYSISHGMCMISKSGGRDCWTFVPFCLLPSPFPRNHYLQLKSLQRDVNLLMHRVAHDHEFLENCLQGAIETDKFTASIYRIYEQVREKGFPQLLSLGLLRSDYFLDVDTAENRKMGVAKQVEVNTIAASYGGLSPILQNQQKHTLKNLGLGMHEDHMPENKSDEQLAKGLVAAWNAYKKEKAVIMFVVEETTYNICDQRMIEYAITKLEPQIKVIRRRFSELVNCSLKEGNLIVDGDEVAVVYYRTGYSPEQMNEKNWEIRLLIEMSFAIKCPSVQYHLAGTKKVQQVLATPGSLDRFFMNKATVDRLRNTFAGLYSLDLTPEGHKAAEKAIANPTAYVLKPQREGGGHNVYGEKVKQELLALGRTKEREGYILMDLITPPVNTNYIVRPGFNVELANVVSELGIFGVILGDQDEVLENYEAGFIVRSKTTGTSEGGISAGYGVLDSLLLV
ncbi:glutathione synthetase [Ixodes scapularis]